MFDDNRSKKIVLVSHCILNQNAISDGTADYAGVFTEIASMLIEAKLGIIQLPCPEVLCLGLDRGDSLGFTRPVIEENTRIRSQLLREDSLKRIDLFVEDTLYQVNEYLKHDFDLVGIIGVNRSPSCGVDTTSENNLEVDGMGVFMDRLNSALKDKNINIPLIGVKTSKLKEAIQSVGDLLGA